MSEEATATPVIEPTENGPYRVEGLENLTNRGGPLETRSKVFLCRCGGSANKPFCDGTHNKNGFSSAKLPGRVEDRLDTYQGEHVAVLDNRGICAHIGHCTGKLPSVFRSKTEPWVHPDAASEEEVEAAVHRCPSGALALQRESTHVPAPDRPPAVFVSPNGPYMVTGGVQLTGAERGQGASTEHFTLCRCGGSKNKPFCDGTHWHIGFEDDKN